jgi:CRISPR-associated RAMP protein (TIGR02581 family)
MLKKMVSEAHFTLRITTEGPLLIKSGRATVSGPDMTPVLTFRNGRQEVFIPGSSLKGMFRSHIEKIVCSLKPHVVCYPFSGNEDKEADLEQRRKDYRDSCGELFNNNERAKRQQGNVDNAEFIYANSCPACRLFGSTSFIGRIAIDDAYLVSKEIKEQRDGIGIDRLTGGASHGAKFELEVVSAGVTFETDIHLRNFEIWQLGMLFAVIQDLQDGLIRIGSGRSRGMGKIVATISSQQEDDQSKGLSMASLRGSEEPSHQLWGLGRWLNDGSYGTSKDDLLQLSTPVRKADQGIRSVRVFQGDVLNALQDTAIAQFVSKMQIWPEFSLKSISNH